jgi:hypothetical protein
MAERGPNWRADLLTTYPDLFHPVGDPPSAQGWPEVGAGWQDMLQRACARIRAAVHADGGTFNATQIKEKYGTLRFYWDGALSSEAAARVEDAIDLAEARSAVTCEICGQPGRLCGGGWLTTRCVTHAEGRQPIEAQPGDHIHIQVIERVVGGRSQTLWRRYDRDSDSFVDVDPNTLEKVED